MGSTEKIRRILTLVERLQSGRLYNARQLAGLIEIVANPRILAALNPYYGLEFLLTHGLTGLVTLGAVFLVVTGSEALYNDLGHFGRKPIQTAWLYIVLPALLLNYFWCWRIRRPSTTPSICCFPSGRSTRWWRSPPPPP